MRNSNYQRGSLGIRERHNERKNSCYANPDIDPGRAALNVHFKEPEGTYTECFDRLIQDGTISTRGLKPNANIVCEFVFDVNTAWFEEKGGYEFAKDFFTEAYQMAVAEVGDERYILSAVMHADERNKALSEELGRDAYHYHLHVVYVPVVEKEIRWSKRCKEEALRGTVKETIHQVSCSKKWAFHNAVDEQGQPVLGKNGQQIRIPSYRQLQDRFFEHMRDVGYDELQRGVMGSDAQNLTTLEYKVQQEQRRLEEKAAMVDRQEEKLKKLSSKLTTDKAMIKTFGELDSAGRRTLLGKRELEEKEYIQIVKLAKEGVLSRPKIADLSRKLSTTKEDNDALRRQYDRLYQQVKPFLRAIKVAPKLVMDFLSDILQRGRTKHTQIKSHQKDQSIHL